MSLLDSTQQKDDSKAQSFVLVRRFTEDHLKGETTLERATISAQQEQNATERADHRIRLQALYQDPDRDPRDFPIDEMDSAGLALQKVCDQLELTEKPSAWAKMGFQRHPARATTNEIMTKMAARDFGDLRRIVQGFETKWKGNQNTVGHRFRDVCDKLDRCKDVFAIFPSQDMYTSVLCGSLSLIVSVAVNHNEIAELLSEAVADVSDKASHAAKLLLLYPHNSTLRRLFAGLYANIFLFYHDAISWYTESKLGRALKSFNAGLKDRYQKATAKIDNCLGEIYRIAGIAQDARLWVKSDLLEDKLDSMQEKMEAKIDRMGRQICDQLFAGQAALQTLRTMFESARIEASVQQINTVQRIEAGDPRDTSITEDAQDRSYARAFDTALKQFVVGTEGPSLFKDGQFWLPDVDISFKLGEWISPDTKLSTLWISSPALSQGFPGSRAAALVAAVAAWESELLIISHFCERPYPGDVPAEQTPEQVGLIGLVYSLIIQLLRFNVKEDTFRTSKEKLERLDGSDSSWPEALLLLQSLLRATPQLQRCIIDGLNELCFSDGADWCGAFLEVLFEHQKLSRQHFKILLTTNGLSRVLPDYVRLEDQAEVQRGARELIRGGRWLSAAER